MFINHVPSYFSEDQVRAYLLKTKFPSFSSNSQLPPPTLATLRTLVLQHLLTFPYENTQMHYSPDHLMQVVPSEAYKRLVASPSSGEGSYCCGQNGVLLGVLRALGYATYGGGARINGAESGADKPIYAAVSHAVLFVEPVDACIQLTDVGFGGNGLIRPIDLVEGATVTGACLEEHRLVKAKPPGVARADAAGWALECRYPGSDWRALYVFSEAEFPVADWDALSFATCARRNSGFFWDDVLCNKYIRSDNDIGRLTMNKGKVKRRIGTEAEILREYTTERERVEALKDFFGIVIAEENVKYIEGRVPALPPG